MAMASGFFNTQNGFFSNLLDAVEVLESALAAAMLGAFTTYIFPSWAFWM